MHIQCQNWVHAPELDENIKDPKVRKKVIEYREKLKEDPGYLEGVAGIRKKQK